MCRAGTRVPQMESYSLLKRKIQLRNMKIKKQKAKKFWLQKAQHKNKNLIKGDEDTASRR